MHVDESTNSIPPNEPDPRSASDRTPAIADALPADLAMSRQPDALGRLFYCDQISLRPNDPRAGASAAVYCGSEEAVALGFRIAMSAMATAAFEETAERRGTEP
jgi:hypothetical protein